MKSNTAGAGTLVVIFVVSAVICVWDFYAALHGRGNVGVAWALGAVMLLIALGSLRKLIRRDYSNSLW